jgi:hypothetical protein
VSRYHDAWNLIPTGGDFSTITADQVRELSGLEPRLMMKFDHSGQLPPALKDGGKFILPLKNGLYAILRGTGYHQPEPCPAVVNYARQTSFHLGTSEAGVSEMQHLDLAFNTGLLSEFLGETVLYPTIRGRKRSPAFSFKVDEHELQVDGVQVEIDGGYEGRDCVVVVEAKIGECDDFHLRQIYYPFRFWLKHSSKRVRPVFFTFDPASGVYRFREYLFAPPELYQPPRLVKAAAYRLVDPEVSSRRAVPVKRTAPIPQADKLSRIAEIPILVALGYNTSKTLAERLELDPRQGSYYLDAACSVGLLQRSPYRLSDLGQQYVDSPGDVRLAILARSVLGVPLIQELLISLLLAPEGRLGRTELLAIMGRSSELKESTAARRAQTLWAWLSWVAQHGGRFSVSGEEIVLVGPSRTVTKLDQTVSQLELF